MRNFTIGQRVQVIGSYAWGTPAEWSNATVVAIAGREIDVTFSNGSRWVALSSEVRSI